MDCRCIKQPRIIIAVLAVMLACLAGCAKTQDPVNVTLEILDADGVSTEFSLNTSKITLGDALWRQAMSRPRSIQTACTPRSAALRPTGTRTAPGGSFPKMGRSSPLE